MKNLCSLAKDMYVSLDKWKKKWTSSYNIVFPIDFVKFVFEFFYWFSKIAIVI